MQPSVYRHFALALAHGAALVDQYADANLLGRELGDGYVNESELRLDVEQLLGGRVLVETAPWIDLLFTPVSGRWQ